MKAGIRSAAELQPLVRVRELDSMIIENPNLAEIVIQAATDPG